jgi:ABC-type uncharacterized transport system involved in gliding motility auxiliary subunit
MKSFLDITSKKFTAYASLYVLVVLAVLGVANYLAQRHNKSFDTTANKRFSLSDQTQKIVKELKTDAKIRYFDRQSSFQGARDLLDRYDNLSSRLSVEFKDPDKEPVLAKSLGLRVVPTIYVEANGKREEAKSLTEEELTSALIRTLKSGVRTVCAVTGSGEHSIEDNSRKGYSQLKALIEKNNYRTREISLIEKPEIPEECTIVMIAGPKYDYLEPAVKAVKAYVEGGGRLLAMLDPPMKLGRDEVKENAALAGVLKEWGATLNKDLVLDTSGVGQLFGFNAAVPLAVRYEAHPISQSMKGTATAFPMVRSVDGASNAAATVEKLVSTSENSLATSNLANAEIELDPKKDKKGPFALAVAGSLSGEKKGRFVVAGSSEWVSDSILRFQGNSDLFMNMMNWLSSDEDLISIRPKDPENRPLNMNAAQVRTVLLFSVVFVPLAIVAWGGFVAWRRR